MLVTNAKRDPTRTAGLRAEYARACKNRFGKVKHLITETVVENDALMLGKPQPRRLKLHAAATRYDFPSDPAGKAQAFMDWLRDMVDSEVLEVTWRDGQKIASRSEWQNLYVRTAYTKAVAAADENLRKGGVRVPDLQIWALFNQPMHANTLALLFTRNFENLRDITGIMAGQISRSLTEGMARGLGAMEIARLLNGRVDGIGMRRAILLARTEVIHAYAEASLNRYEEFGINEVVGEVEFATAGDHRVCEKCKSMNYKTYTIKEARGIIPVHPQCRCAWKPVIMQTNRRRVFSFGRAYGRLERNPQYS